jgi:hypothetical protein
MILIWEGVCSIRVVAKGVHVDRDELDGLLRRVLVEPGHVRENGRDGALGRRSDRGGDPLGLRRARRQVVDPRSGATPRSTCAHLASRKNGTGGSPAHCGIPTVMYPRESRTYRDSEKNASLVMASTEAGSAEGAISRPRAESQTELEAFIAAQNGAPGAVARRSPVTQTYTCRCFSGWWNGRFASCTARAW